MWVSVIFFTIVALLIAGYLWESRKKRMLHQRSRIAAKYAGTGHAGYYNPHGISYGAESGSAFSGDCGGGGGGGDGGGGGGC